MIDIEHIEDTREDDKYASMLKGVKPLSDAEKVELEKRLTDQRNARTAKEGSMKNGTKPSAFIKMDFQQLTKWAVDNNKNGLINCLEFHRRNPEKCSEQDAIKFALYHYMCVSETANQNYLDLLKSSNQPVIVKK